MKSTDRFLRLRVYFGEGDRYFGKPLFEVLVARAREMQLAGATVYRCPMGYGSSRRVHTGKILRASDDLPMIMEVVDTEERIREFVPVVEKMFTGGMLTLEPVTVVRYARGSLSD